MKTKFLPLLGICFLFPFCSVERRAAKQAARLQLPDGRIYVVTRDTVFYSDTVFVNVPEMEQTNEVFGGWFAVPDGKDTVLVGDAVRLEIRRDTVIRFRTVVKERGIAVPVADTIYLTKERVVNQPAAEHADKFAWLYALLAALAAIGLYFTQKRKDGNG